MRVFNLASLRRAPRRLPLLGLGLAPCDMRPAGKKRRGAQGTLPGVSATYSPLLA